MKIHLEPIPMTKELMISLEKKGLIFLLAPERHFVPGLKEETKKVTPIYISENVSGPHKLIAVTKNISSPENFGCHSDNEEFLLIGNPNSKKLYLLVALDKEDVMTRKYREGTLTEEDFVLIDCKFNDVECSFFTMLKGTVHSEFSALGPGTPPSFYVTEPDGITTNFYQYPFFYEKTGRFL